MGATQGFADAGLFWSSPLYRELSAAASGDPVVVDLLSHARAGQVPSLLLFGAVHYLLLGGAADDGAHGTTLAAYYPSLHGAARAAAVGAAGPFGAFVRAYRVQLDHLVRTRLVQTNHVQRAVGLRAALRLIAAQTGVEAVHLLEVGCSAGLVLRQGAYGYRLGGRSFGAMSAPVQLAAEWRSADPPPDLDAIPRLLSVTGIDLAPPDPADASDRRWLRALVWPENERQAQQLTEALDLAATLPVPVWTGDAVDLCPRWHASLPAGEARVVFHCATRVHVPPDRRPAFDDAVNPPDAHGPVYEVAIEDPVDAHLRWGAAGVGLRISWPDGRTTTPLAVDGHLAWLQPLP